MTVEIGQRYRHFKGGEYEIIALAKDCESLEDVVVYRSLYSSGNFKIGQIWTRSLEDFVRFKKVGGKKVKRFELVG
ncbi:MAG: DUF1653 domain-containing protein [archaeon]